MVLIIIFLWVSISTAAGFSPGDIEWGSPVSGTLYDGGILINGEYTVKAVQFSSPVPGIKNLQGNVVPDAVIYPMVYLEIYKNDVFIDEVIMNMTSGPYVDPDYEVKVSVTNFPKRNSREWVYEFYNPWATVSIQTRAKPELDVRIMTDKITYTTIDDRFIEARVLITNSGEASARNVDVKFSADELKLNSGQPHQYISRIDKNSVESFLVILAIPVLTEENTYNLSVDARGQDVKGLEYKAGGSSSITVVTVSPKKQDYFTLSKALRDRIYLDNNETVTITAENGGINDISDISIKDSMNENFELESNTSLEWNIPLLKPGQEWRKTYSMKPLKADLDGFSIPEATAIFTVNKKSYKASSDTTSVVVNGPVIVLHKTVDKNPAAIGEDVTVSVSINNIGNIRTKAEVKDSLPDGVSLVSGQTSLAPTFLELNELQGFSYIIRRDTEGEIQLPAAEANYTAIFYRGTRSLGMSSETPIITFMEPDEIPSSGGNSTNKTAPNQTAPGKKNDEATFMPRAPDFGIVAGVIGLIISAVYLQHRNRTKR